MVKYGDRICPRCGGPLIFYDKVKRILRSKRRDTTWINLDRYRCTQCGSVHREISPLIFPYKQYEYELILGVLEGWITEDTYGYENYPTELTMHRWREKFIIYNGKQYVAQRIRANQEID